MNLGPEKGNQPVNPGRCCPNCRSNNFVETVSREYCPDCNLECDYWGNGANDVYHTMMQNNWAAEEREHQKQLDEEYDNY